MYLYKCTPHLPLGVVGVIQVGKPVNLEQTKVAATALSASMATNQDRLEEYLGQVEQLQYPCRRFSRHAC